MGLRFLFGKITVSSLKGRTPIYKDSPGLEFQFTFRVSLVLPEKKKKDWKGANYQITEL